MDLFADAGWLGISDTVWLGFFGLITFLIGKHFERLARIETNKKVDVVSAKADKVAVDAEVTAYKTEIVEAKADRAEAKTGELEQTLIATTAHTAQKVEACEIRVEEVKAATDECTTTAISKMDKKLDIVVQQGNGRLGAQMKDKAELARKMANETGRTEDIATANAAEKEHREHMAADAAVEDKQWKP